MAEVNSSNPQWCSLREVQVVLVLSISAKSKLVLFYLSPTPFLSVRILCEFRVRYKARFGHILWGYSFVQRKQHMGYSYKCDAMPACRSAIFKRSLYGPIFENFKGVVHPQNDFFSLLMTHAFDTWVQQYFFFVFVAFLRRENVFSKYIEFS